MLKLFAGPQQELSEDLYCRWSVVEFVLHSVPNPTGITTICIAKKPSPILTAWQHFNDTVVSIVLFVPLKVRVESNQYERSEHRGKECQAFSRLICMQKPNLKNWLSCRTRSSNVSIWSVLHSQGAGDYWCLYWCLHNMMRTS